MSYLNNLHLAFSGRFQSDVSTVNNDVRHFDNETFKPDYQEYSKGKNLNGWWNPCGSGAFRLIDCKVAEVGYSDGTTVSTAVDDPAVGMLIGGSDAMVSGKMVDLDPQMQMVSEIWGLTMRLTDGKTSGFFEGQFLPAPFRDILFGRQQGGAGGDQTAAAIYQSVLSGLSWVDDTGKSRFLRELKEMAGNTGDLSVRMMVYSYNMDNKNAEFTIGRVSGVIGPAFSNEPETFISGRRFAPSNGTSTPDNVNFFNAQVDSANKNLCVDLSNALPLSGGEGNFVDIGELQLVILNTEAIQGQKLKNQKDFVRIGSSIPYLQANWMNRTGALFNVALPEALIAKVQSSPLALIRLNNGDNEVVIRETAEGLLIRVDQVVHRLMPTADASVAFYASRYGVPSSGEKIVVSVQPAMKHQGGSGATSVTPIINIPASAISLDPDPVTGVDGKAVYSIFATAPGNPRGYIDGQLYLLSYGPVDNSTYLQYQFDFIATLVFDEFRLPKSPTWDDIKPIMQQYGNLYPIMSRMLVNLGNYDSVVKFRSLLELAFSRPISDPNYMPVTRDLSPGKRQMILQWLTTKDASGHYTLAPGSNISTAMEETQACASCSLLADSEEALSEAVLDDDIKGSKQLADVQYRRNFKQ